LFFKLTYTINRTLITASRCIFSPLLSTTYQKEKTNNNNNNTKELIKKKTKAHVEFMYIVIQKLLQNNSLLCFLSLWVPQKINPRFFFFIKLKLNGFILSLV